MDALLPKEIQFSMVAVISPSLQSFPLGSSLTSSRNRAVSVRHVYKGTVLLSISTARAEYNAVTFGRCTPASPALAVYILVVDLPIWLVLQALHCQWHSIGLHANRLLTNLADIIELVLSKLIQVDKNPTPTPGTLRLHWYEEPRFLPFQCTESDNPT